MTLRKRVYIAGPITKGHLFSNLKQATDAYLQLMRAGLAPHCPHLSAFAGGPSEIAVRGESHVIAVAERLPAGTTHDDWMGIDLPWVAVADALLRLPGASAGADLEVEFASRRGVPVFESVEAVIEWSKS